MFRWLYGLSASLLLVLPQVRAAESSDPLRSPLWEAMRTRFLGDAPVSFDPRVTVTMPATAEDSLNVPVHVHVQGLSDIEKVVVFADLNPIPKIIQWVPGDALHDAPVDFSFSFKVEQSSPVRAAVFGQGRWHVGGAWVSAAGGGCTAPSQGTSLKLWQDRLGELSGRLFARQSGSRLKLHVIHPMDTGLAAGIPVFHLQSLALLDEQGTPLAYLHPFEPISENPVFTVDLPTIGPIQVQGHDTQGNAVAGWVMP